MKNNVLLIGGAGFLGSSLASRFAEMGTAVGILDRFPLAGHSAELSQFTGELRDTHLLRQALRDFTRVVFLAHETRVAPSADRLPANFLSNIELLLIVLEEARESNVEEFVLFSSGGAVYGKPETMPIREDFPNHPCSPYGIAKLTMEKYVAMVADQSGFRHLELRPSNPYGPGQNFKAAQGIVAVAMARIACGEPITIRGDGSATKDYLFVGDFADACVRLVLHPEAAGPFNIGSGYGLRLLELISKIEQTVGKKAQLIFEPVQPGDVTANVLDISKVHHATGWKPSTTIDAGLAQTWAWMEPKLSGNADEKPAV